MYSELNETLTATAMDDQILKIQIPDGLIAGDSFIVTPPQGRVFTVIVPEGARGGMMVDVMVPDEIETTHSPLSKSSSSSSSKDQDAVKVNKATLGAALVGGIVGCAILGPIAGIALAGAAAYTSTKGGKVGEMTRAVGTKTYKVTGKAKNWAVRKFEDYREKKDKGLATAKNEEVS